MGRRSESTVFLKNCIGDAVIELLKEKPLDKITVDEIATRAGVGRATYFRYFKSKGDAVIFRLITLWIEYAEEKKLESKNAFTKANALAFFTFYTGIKDTMDLLYSRGLANILFDSFKFLAEANQQYGGEIYHDRFFLYGLFGVLDNWITSGYAETPAEMAEKLIEIFSSIPL